VVDIKEIAEYVKANVPGCKFVGLSDENEIFLELEEGNPELEAKIGRQVGGAFENCTKVTFVIKPSMESIQHMVDELNKVLDEEPKPKKDDLLDIGSF